MSDLLFDIRIIEPALEKTILVSTVRSRVTAEDITKAFVSKLNLPSDTPAELFHKTTGKKVPLHHTLQEVGIKSDDTLIVLFGSKGSHKIIRLSQDSSYVGMSCPITRVQLNLGEEVVICQTTEVAFLKIGWDFIANQLSFTKCPYCELDVLINRTPKIIFDSTSLSSILPPSRSEPHPKEELQSRLHIHCRNLSWLEEQKAKYTSLNVPVHVLHQIDEEKAEIERLQKLLR